MAMLRNVTPKITHLLTENIMIILIQSIRWIQLNVREMFGIEIVPPKNVAEVDQNGHFV